MKIFPSHASYGLAMAFVCIPKLIAAKVIFFLAATIFPSPIAALMNVEEKQAILDAHNVIRASAGASNMRIMASDYSCLNRVMRFFWRPIDQVCCVIVLRGKVFLTILATSHTF